MTNISLLELLVMGSNILLVLLLLLEVLDWAVLSPIPCERWPRGFSFDYADGDGPHAWQILFPESNGTNQSPINITTRSAMVVQPSKPLNWKGYENVPVFMRLSNSQSTVVLEALWNDPFQPKIGGGPLNHTYRFHSLVFHWGYTDDEGSEHTLDYLRYPMELQVIHARKPPKSPPLIANKSETLVIVSVFLEVTRGDNPYLDHIVNNLWRITEPRSTERITPFPLKWIFPNFEKGYYTYCGSLTQPPCSEIVRWIVYPQSIAISSSQVNKNFLISFLV